MNIIEIDQNNFSKAISLLKNCNLPTEDITAATKLFVAIEGNEVVGTVGVEFYGKHALLRSLAVNDSRRGSGTGKLLVRFIEGFAKNNGITQIFLLTTTAPEFFSRLSYSTIKREDVSATVQQSSEFTSACPSSAIAMKKSL
jgi:amino-acid N-acetyltransferase